MRITTYLDRIPVPFFEQRKKQQREDREAAAVESAERRAGSMTRGERDALGRTPVAVVSHVDGPRRRQRKTHVNPERQQVKAARTARRSNRRGA